MPVAKKEQTTNACGKERMTKPQMLVANKKMAALISQANSWHQMKETKQRKPPQDPKRLPTCKHKVEKTPPNHNSLIDYCLQQRSGWLQS